MSCAPVHAYPDLSRGFRLYTDTSQYAVGVVLVREFEASDEVIQHLSHQLGKGQRKWPTNDQTSDVEIDIIDTIAADSDSEEIDKIQDSEFDYWDNVLKDEKSIAAFKKQDPNITGDFPFRVMILRIISPAPSVVTRNRTCNWLFRMYRRAPL